MQFFSLIFPAWKNNKKYTVKFFYCENCGFLQTEKPFWLNEAYHSTITDTDVGLVNRNILYSNKTTKFIRIFLNPHGRFIDYGGGYGLFVRMMRDNGYKFFRHDPLTENIFAKQFDASTNEKYDLLTAWEVFEHLENPIESMREMLKLSDNILFSTLLLPNPPERIEDWWYYGLEHGQHIAFYSKRTLEFLTRVFSLNLVFTNNSIHYFSKFNYPSYKNTIFFNNMPIFLRKLFLKRNPKTLIDEDYQYQLKRKSGNQ